MLRKMPKTSCLEPEILLIEVAYFLAVTEYTFSAHCTVCKLVSNLYRMQGVSNLCGQVETSKD
jgi:hypothetical protein